MSLEFGKKLLKSFEKEPLFEDLAHPYSTDAVTTSPKNTFSWMPPNTSELEARFKRIAARISNQPSAKQYCTSIPPLIFQNTARPIAHTTTINDFPISMNFSTGICNPELGLINCNNDNEIAIVIGHEIAHTCNFFSEDSSFRYSRPNFSDLKLGEIRADIFGVLLASEGGYDVSVAPVMWRRVIQKSGPLQVALQKFAHTKQSDPHPPFQDRASYLNLLVDWMKSFKKKRSN